MPTLHIRLLHNDHTQDDCTLAQMIAYKMIAHKMIAWMMAVSSNNVGVIRFDSINWRILCRWSSMERSTKISHGAQS